MPSPMKTQHTHNYVSGSMRDLINRGCYFRVSVPAWASGGYDIGAESADVAALEVGCRLAPFGSRVPLSTEVFRHLPSSSIGAAMLETCGTFQTLTADHYAI